MPLVYQKQAYGQVPPAVKLFALRAVACLAAWLLLYHLLLKPLRVPDKWLTSTSASATVRALNLCYAPGFGTMETDWTDEAGSKADVFFIRRHGAKLLYVKDECNALQLAVVYVGFLLCVPTGAKKTTIYALAGVAGIFVLNIARLYALTLICINCPQWLGFAHHYLFTLIVYGCMFGGWVLYTKKYEPRKTI